MAQLHHFMGAAFVRQVITVLETIVTSSAQANVAAASQSWNLPAIVRVTAVDGLRVRRTADATVRHNVIGGLAPREEIEALAIEGEWLRISYRGASAYIHSGYVETAERAASTSSNGIPPDLVPRVDADAEPTHSPTPLGATPGDAPRESGRSAASPERERTPATNTPVAAGWVLPASVRLTDPELLRLASRVRDPILDQLTRNGTRSRIPSTASAAA